MINETLLQIRKLTITHKKKNILNKIDLDITKGEIILLAGKNGSGKSTLLKTIAGVSVQDTGSITFNTDSRKNSIGFLSDNCSMYSDFSIKEMIKLHCRIHDIRDFNCHILDRFLPDRSKKIKSLSTGMKAILLLSLIIAQKPSMILIDEILQHIDPYVRDTILNQLLDMAVEHNTTIIVVNHFTGDIERIPDRIILMEEGKIPLDSTPDNLLEKCRKIVSRDKIVVKDLPIIHCKEDGHFKEYYLYPVEESFQHQNMEKATLSEIISALIGGYYVN